MKKYKLEKLAISTPELKFLVELWNCLLENSSASSVETWNNSEQKPVNVETKHLKTEERNSCQNARKCLLKNCKKLQQEYKL